MPKKSPKSKSAKKKNSTKQVVEQVAVVEETSLAEEFISLTAAIGALKTQLTQLNAKVKALDRRAKKEIKAATRNSKKKGKNTGSKKKTGFTAPAPITDELAVFLGKEPGTWLARTEVTKELSKYFKKHNLQNPENRRIIFPNKQVKKLLRLKSGDELSYFNLQRYISPHFPKKKKAVTQ